MSFEPFDLYTPGARRLYHFEFHSDQALLSAEIRRVLDGLAAAAPTRIAKGQISDAEAKQQVVLWLSIAEDLEAMDRWIAEGSGRSGWSLSEKLRELRAVNHVDWPDKIAVLRNEITARRIGYPADVAKGRLTSDQAKAQLERIEAVHDLYWRHGFAFSGTREELRELGEVVADHDLHQQQVAA